MKIKAVCDRTGLTDRAVRHYIEEELIHPAYTENYLGRRTFDFTEEDVTLLSEIATLRKFDFSVGEIRDMLRDSAAIRPTVEALRARKAAHIEGEKTLLRQLSEAEMDEVHTVSELVALLCRPAEAMPAPEETEKRGIWRTVGRCTVRLLQTLLVLLPPLIVVVSVADGLRLFAYPIISKKALLWSAVSLVPTVLFFLAHVLTREEKHRRTVRITALCLCVYSIPLSVIGGLGLISHSETRDMRHYRELDATCVVGRFSFYQQLFPSWAHYFEVDGNGGTVYLDAHYYYRYMRDWDYTYDIYAEWPLEQEAFEHEVARVTALYEGSEYRVIQKGSYTCLVRSGSPHVDPFSEMTDNYQYDIFAYDRDRLRVRYISCGSLENGVDQPHYLSLDW